MNRTPVFLLGGLCLFGLGFFRDVRITEGGNLIDQSSWGGPVIGLGACLVCLSMALLRLTRTPCLAVRLSECDEWMLPIAVCLPLIVGKSSTNVLVHGSIVVEITHGWGGGSLQSVYFLTALITALVTQAAYFGPSRPPIIAARVTA